MLPGGMAVEGVSGLAEDDVRGVSDGQAVPGRRHHAAGGTVDDRDRAAPGPLARDAPVPQAKDRGALAGVVRLKPGDGRSLGGFDVQAIQEAGIEQGAGTGPGLLAHLEGRRVRPRGQDDRPDRQAILPGEVQVALVMGRAAEDGARAVVHEDEVGDPDGQFEGGVEGVADPQARIEAQLLGGLDLGLGDRAAPAGVDEGGSLGTARRDFRRQGMVGGHAHEGGAEQGVRSGRIDFQPVRSRRIGEAEGETGPPGPANPVLLHDPDLLGPALQGLQVVGQGVGVVGDPQEPLAQPALLHDRAGSPAPAVDDLLVGQDRLVHRIPVDQALLAIDQALLEQVQEPGLLAPVIAHVAGRELPRPVDGQAKFLQLVPHPADVVVGPALGVDATLHGGVLCGQAKGIPAHGVKDIEAPGALVPRDHVAEGVVAHMTHVQPARRIGEHLEDVVLGP